MLMNRKKLSKLEKNLSSLTNSVTCPICLSQLFEPTRTIPCDHVFCKDCIGTLFSQNGIKTKCPLCNESLRTKRALRPSDKLKKVVAGVSFLIETVKEIQSMPPVKGNRKRLLEPRSVASTGVVDFDSGQEPNPPASTIPFASTRRTSAKFTSIRNDDNKDESADKCSPRGEHRQSAGSLLGFASTWNMIPDTVTDFVVPDDYFSCKLPDWSQQLVSVAKQTPASDFELPAEYDDMVKSREKKRKTSPVGSDTGTILPKEDSSSDGKTDQRGAKLFPGYRIPKKKRVSHGREEPSLSDSSDSKAPSSPELVAGPIDSRIWQIPVIYGHGRDQSTTSTAAGVDRSYEGQRSVSRRQRPRVSNIRDVGPASEGSADFVGATQKIHEPPTANDSASASGITYGSPTRLRSGFWAVPVAKKNLSATVTGTSSGASSLLQSTVPTPSEEIFCLPTQPMPGRGGRSLPAPAMLAPDTEQIINGDDASRFSDDDHSMGDYPTVVPDSDVMLETADTTAKEAVATIPEPVSHVDDGNLPDGSSDMTSQLSDYQSVEFERPESFADLEYRQPALLDEISENGIDEEPLQTSFLEPTDGEQLDEELLKSPISNSFTAEATPTCINETDDITAEMPVCENRIGDILETDPADEGGKPSANIENDTEIIGDDQSHLEAAQNEREIPGLEVWFVKEEEYVLAESGHRSPAGSIPEYSAEQSEEYSSSIPQVVDDSSLADTVLLQGPDDIATNSTAHQMAEIPAAVVPDVQEAMPMEVPFKAGSASESCFELTIESREGIEQLSRLLEMQIHKSNKIMVRLETVPMGIDVGENYYHMNIEAAHGIADVDHMAIESATSDLQPRTSAPAPTGDQDGDFVDLKHRVARRLSMNQGRDTGITTADPNLEDTMPVVDSAPVAIDAFGIAKHLEANGSIVTDSSSSATFETTGECRSVDSDTPIMRQEINAWDNHLVPHGNSIISQSFDGSSRHNDLAASLTENLSSMFPQYFGYRNEAEPAETGNMQQPSVEIIGEVGDAQEQANQPNPETSLEDLFGSATGGNVYSSQAGKNILFCFTGLTFPLEIITRFTDMFGTRYSEIFSPAVTHVIVNTEVRNGSRLCARRTMPYFRAIAQGKWVLDPNWIVKSVKEETLRDPTGYEIQGDVINGKTLAPGKARTSRKWPLYDVAVYLHGLFDHTTPKDGLAALIKDLGGTVYDTIESLQNDLSEFRVILAHKPVDESDGQINIAQAEWDALYEKYKIPIVDADWVLVCVEQWGYEPHGIYSLSPKPEKKVEENAISISID